MDYKKEIIKKINSISGRYSNYEVFSDWVKCSALSIDNFSSIRHGKLWESREKQYTDSILKYTESERKVFPELLALLIEALTEEIEDVLGSVYMEGEMGNKATGQFFTPFHVSLLNARLMKYPENVSPEHPLLLNEPSTGGGGMILAVVRTMKERGINPQTCLRVVAQDLDWKGVYMTYLQLSLLGIKATVVQGDTLQEPFTDLRHYPPERVLLTPAQKGAFPW